MKRTNERGTDVGKDIVNLKQVEADREVTEEKCGWGGQGSKHSWEGAEIPCVQAQVRFLVVMSGSSEPIFSWSIVTVDVFRDASYCCIRT